MNYYAHLQEKVKKALNFVGIQNASAAHMTEAVLVAVIALGAAGGYYAYQTYVQNREKRAYEAFLEVTNAYLQAQDSAFKSAMPGNNKSEVVDNIWKDVEIIIDAGYKANASSYLAPFFLAYKANVLLEQGKPALEAYECMKQALSKASSRSNFYDVLALKAAKIACDCSDEAIKAQGLKDLKKLAQDETSVAYVEALYTLGVYYLVHNEFENAKTEFSKIVELEQTDLFGLSFWVNAAKEKLAAL